MICKKKKKKNKYIKEVNILENKSIKDTARAKGVKLWEVAEKLGICDTTFSRRLRRQLQPEETARILAIIDEISADKTGKGRR